MTLKEKHYPHPRSPWKLLREAAANTCRAPRAGPVPSREGSLFLPGALSLPSPVHPRGIQSVLLVGGEDCLSSESESKSQRVYGDFNLSSPTE